MHINDEMWSTLRQLAVEAMHCAYVPYSGYPVGAAAVTQEGRLVSGCNVENSAYGVGLCAECGLISELMRSGGGKLAAFVCINGNAEVIVPCGRCRQLLSEHAAADMQIEMPTGVMSIDEVLPMRFGQADLTKVESATFKESNDD